MLYQSHLMAIFIAIIPGLEKSIRKYTANRTWGNWSSINFCSEIWNRLDISLRDAELLTSIKRGLSKAFLGTF